MDLRLASLLLVAAVAVAGCSGSGTTSSSSATTPPTTEPAMAFAEHRLPAVHQGHGLYEPTIDVGMDGILYVSAHSTGIGVLPAPGYYSTDDGATWHNLGVTGPVAAPSSTQGAPPPLSDEIFIVAGADGMAWGVDINLRDYIVAGWCGGGTELCYYNPNAYDHAQVVLQAAECQPVPLKDRPWAAYANGTLLMVNNPGGGPAQIASMRVPPTVPVDAGPAAAGIQWNLCASSGGFIPGIPGMRGDLFFGVPQVQGADLAVILGNAGNVLDVTERIVMPYSNAGVSEVGDYGQVVFDATGAMFVGAMANNGTGPGEGGIRIAVSADDGANFTVERFALDLPVSSFYLDGNPNGPGALLNWGVVDADGTDWYFAHVFLEAGRVVLRNVQLAVDDGPEASRHVQGAAVGPDGRAYMVMSDVSGNDDAAMAAAIGTMPLRVVVQTAGPTLPGAAAQP